MQRVYLKIVLVAFFSCVNLFKAIGQNEKNRYEVSLNGGLASSETLPFWMVSNRRGSIPSSDYLELQTTLYADFKKENKKFGMAYKFSAVGFVSNKNELQINEAYLRFQLKKWAFDIGSTNDAIKWKGLSSSNGNIVKSNNARAIPGLTIKTLDFIKLPVAKKWLRMQVSFGNYLMNDNRFTDDVKLHSKSLYFKAITSRKFSIIAGLDHYAQWGGTSPVFGKQPASFKDFLKVVLGSAGGENAMETDQINALGSSLGSYLLQLNYLGEKSNFNFYYSHPFEDRSGYKMMNYPDGLYGFFVDFKKEKAIIENMLAEFTYTKHSSGSKPNYIDENGIVHPTKGMDNYFNNSIYRSGWTYFGRTIGSPFFTTVHVDENGITKGVILGDNRFMAFNIGFKGTIKKVSYKALLSHTTYFGWFGNEYIVKPKQFSSLVELNFPRIASLPFNFSLGAAFDTGTYRPVNFGGFLKLSSRGVF